MKNRWLVRGVIPGCLLAGLFIYFITRSEVIWLNKWLGAVSDRKVLVFFQSLMPNSSLPDWIIYSLPDALWMFALIMVILVIWDFRVHKKSMIWLLIAIVAGILFEVLQVSPFMKGTFDPVDLILTFLAAIIPVTIILLRSRNHELQ